MTFDEWFEKHFGHGVGGVADEDINLQLCWDAATWQAKREVLEEAAKWFDRRVASDAGLAAGRADYDFPEDELRRMIEEL